MRRGLEKLHALDNQQEQKEQEQQQEQKEQQMQQIQLNGEILEDQVNPQNVLTIDRLNANPELIFNSDDLVVHMNGK